MSSNEERATTPGADSDHSADQGGGNYGAGHEDVDSPGAAGSHTPRLVGSWLVVGVPLGYGIYQTISRTLPLFGG